MKTTIFYLLTIMLVVWIQAVVNYFAGTSLFSVNVALIVILYFGLFRGPMVGQLCGFILGLLVDAGRLGLIGLHALIYAAAGYGSGMLRRQLDENKVWTQTIFAFATSILYVSLYFLLDRMFSASPHSPSWSTAVQPFLNALVSPVIFWLMQRWSQLWNLTPPEQ